jgi:hypothetical protein
MFTNTNAVSRCSMSTLSQYCRRQLTSDRDNPARHLSTFSCRFHAGLAASDDDDGGGETYIFVVSSTGSLVDSRMLMHSERAADQN